MPIFIEVADGDWLRVHPLAREFLRARIRAWPDEIQLDLHLRAASWLADHAMHEEAVRHAFATGRLQWAYELTERCLRRITLSGHLATVLEWIERLPLAEVERRPWMKLWAGWGLVSGNRHRDAGVLLEPMLKDDSIPLSWRLEAAAIMSAAEYHADRLDSAAEVQNTWRTVPHEKQRRIPVIHQTALSSLYEGRPEMLRHHHAQTAHALGPREMDSLGGRIEWEIGFSYWWEGQAELARTALRAASARAANEIGRRSHLATMLATALAAVLWDCDQPAAAAVVLANRLDVVERSMAVDPMCMGYITAARIANWEGNEGRAFDLLHQLYAVGEARGLKRVYVSSLAEQIRMHARGAHARTCFTLAERLETICPMKSISESGLWDPLCKLQLSMGQAYALIGQDKHIAALKLLDTAARLATRLRRDRENIETTLLQALSLRRMNKDGSSLLSEGSSLARARGLKRIVLDTHFDEPICSALKDSVTQEGSDIGPDIPSFPHVLSGSLLTPKEREVLQLLAQKFSNKEIAKALDIR